MYHPSYYNKEDQSHRSDCEKRLELIRKHLMPGHVIDIGCSGGYYTFGCADTDGCEFAIGIDNSHDEVMKCLEIMNEHDVQNVKFMWMDIENFFANPPVYSEGGTALYMSIHHHIIQKYGMETASFMLKVLSKRFNQMYFDMGQKNEGCYTHVWWQKLPETEDVKAWLAEYLIQNTVYDKINIIGTSTVHGIERYFYCMEKTIDS